MHIYVIYAPPPPLPPLSFTPRFQFSVPPPPSHPLTSPSRAQFPLLPLVSSLPSVLFLSSLSFPSCSSVHPNPRNPSQLPPGARTPTIAYSLSTFVFFPDTPH